MYDWRNSSQTTSTGTADVKTVSPPAPDNQPQAVMISVETNDAWVTIDGTTPSATNRLIFPKAAMPQLVLLGSDTIKFTSSIAGNSILNVVWGY